MPKSDRAGHAQVNGIDLYFAIFNDAGSDPVLLLHGGMGNADDWGNQVPALMERQTVIVADSRGHGRSTHGNAPISYRLMASDVVALLTYLAVDKVAIAGSSDGGIIGLEIAISYPQRLSRLWAEGANSNPGALKDPHGIATLRP
jgi:pimeloyl-ACP methyl ester carboxylesterase